MREPLPLGVPVSNVLAILSEGNPGALNVLAQMAQQPDSIPLVMYLDDMNIRGSQIWVGYKNHCKEDLSKFVECVRSRDRDMVNTINEQLSPRGDGEVAVTHGASFRGQ